MDSVLFQRHQLSISGLINVVVNFVCMKSNGADACLMLVGKVVARGGGKASNSGCRTGGAL